MTPWGSGDIVGPHGKEKQDIFFFFCFVLGWVLDGFVGWFWLVLLVVLVGWVGWLV